MLHEETKTGGLNLSPKHSFILGLVGGVLVLCTLGFFILLSMLFKGNVSLAAGNDTPGVTAPTPTVVPDDGGGDVVGEVKPVSGDDHVRGAKNAAVTLVEYSDFECPFCSRFHPTMQQLLKDFDGKVKWVYRHYPLSFHPQANPAANAAECASEQGKFWEFADKLIENQAVLSDATYARIATELKLNKGKFDSCYAAKKFQARITADQASGTTAGVTGTPGTIIIGKDGSKQMVPGAVPYDQLKAMVEQAL